ncbi:glycosyltransferase [Microbulbifer variabilis]|uniref:Glycosyltransferase n=1 Tax=Microbulbifer variabilis TaxID=266805 RepID=A0ABY4VDL9_9GAMM|nr:glycosyltransferase [Microbulbifer variabilis]USD22372.1 glycosyltransferase [Microbulbifer variabilis]
MDVLLKHAETLARHPVNGLYTPIDKRIAYIVSHGQSYASNGYAVRTQEVAKELNSHGFETLCIVRPGRPWELGAKKNIINAEAEIDGVLYIHSRWHNDQTPADETAHLEACVARFVELFQVYRPAVVLAASDYIIGLPAWIAAKRLNLPFYNEVRGFWELSRAAREPNFENTSFFKIEAERNSFVSKQALEVFTLNLAMRSELVDRGVSANKIHAIPNGINSFPKKNPEDDNLRLKLGIESHDRVIGYVGSLNFYEGLDLLMDSCAELIEQGENIKLLVVGDEQPVNDFITADQRLASKPWLIQVGRVAHEKVADYYALIETVVIPRKKMPVCELVSPMKLVEAMAYGKRIVISDVIPLAENDNKYEDLITFKAEVPSHLTQCLQESLRKPATQNSVINDLTLATRILPLVNILKGLNSKNCERKESNNNSNPRELIKKIEPLPLANKEPIWFQIQVVPGQELVIDANIEYQDSLKLHKHHKRKAVMLLKSKDMNGNEIDQPLGKLAKSTHLDSYFKYLESDKGLEERHKFVIPKGVEQIELGFCAFNYQEGEIVIVREFSVREFQAFNKKKDLIELNQEPLWENFRVNEFIPHSLNAKLKFEKSEDKHSKSIIVRVKYFDKEKKEIPGPYSGLPLSKTVGSFSYISAKEERIVQLMPPKGAVEAAIGLQRWNAKSKVWLDGNFILESEIKVNPTIKTPSVNSREETKTPLRKLSDIKVAAILDEFTMECFRPEVNLTLITPSNWREKLEKKHPDFLFVESCWFGNGNSWSGLMYGYTSNGPNRMDELIKVITYCRQKGIPSIFWAKEDPVHYKRFAPTAKLFDYVYTSDANMIPAYKKDYGIDAQALSFFCQPKVHNPICMSPRNNKAAFAGSYYSDKKERCENFHTIVAGLKQAGINYDIYDRCLKRGTAHLQFPKKYKSHVVGYLEPHEMSKAYKSYRYTINLNTVKHSPTMFARRVYESLACGTPVISNYSEGVITQFGGIVCASDNQREISDFLNHLKNPEEYQRISNAGVRETLGRHTLADRLEQVCERLGILVEPHLPIINVVYTVGSDEEIEIARNAFQKQSYHRKRLVVNLKNSNLLHSYLNRNTDEEIFRVLTEFAKPIDGVELKMDLQDTYSKNFIEDEAIKTQFQVEQSNQSNREFAA